jgi:hypothetical protein
MLTISFDCAAMLQYLCNTRPVIFPLSGIVAVDINTKIRLNDIKRFQSVSNRKS